MRFEKFIEQHGVHCFVAHSVRFALVVIGNQVRTHLFHFFGHEAELWDAIWVKLFLVAKGHRLQRKDRFARLAHRLDCLLETRRGCDCAEMTTAIYDTRYTCWNGRLANPGDVGGGLRPCLPI